MPDMTELQQVYYDRLKSRLDYLKTNVEGNSYAGDGPRASELELLLGRSEGKTVSLHKEESDFQDLYDFALSNQFMPQFKKILVQLNKLVVKYERMTKR